MSTEQKYKLLHDEMAIRDAQWIIALHLERFNCKNSTIPCAQCRITADKLAPLFLIGIEGIAEQDATIHPRAMVKLALDKMSVQKWAVEYPWRKNAIPVIIQPSTSTSATYVPTTRAFDLDDPDEVPNTTPPVTYRLVKRDRENK